MKKCFILLILALSSITTFAQQYKFQGSLTMSGAWPMGKFGSEDINDPKAGFADNGFMLDIETAYYLNHRFSFAGMIFFGTNQVNSGVVGQKLEARVNAIDGIPENAFSDPNNIIFNVNYWLYGGLMAGPRYSLPISNLFLDFKALAGFNVTYLPEQNFFAEIRNDQDVLTEKFGTQSTGYSEITFSALAGTDLRIPVRENISLKLSVNYFYSEVKMTFEDLHIDNPGINAQIISLKKETSMIPVSTLNTGIGLVYYFN